MTSSTGQRTDILNALNTVTLDANGNGQCSVNPSVGQYWAPLLIRVSTKSNSVPVASCTVYHGAVGVKDPTTYIDDTADGNNDTSSIIAGVTVQYGENITAVWANGTPGDIAVLIVNGVTLNTPPSEGQLPQVPGTHFSGKPVTETVTKIGSIPGASPTTIIAGNSISIPGPGTTTTFDMRNFSSFYFVCTPLVNGVPSTWNSIFITFDWFSQTGALNTTFSDSVEIWATQPVPFFFNGGVFTIQDLVHGPYLRITVLNANPVNSINFSYALVGTTRLIANPSYRQNRTDAIMLDSTGNPIPASGTAQEPAQYLHGRFLAMFGNSGANPMTFAIHHGSLVFSINTVVAAGITTVIESIAPKHSIRIDVVGVVGQTYNVRLISLYDKVS